MKNLHLENAISAATSLRHNLTSARHRIQNTLDEPDSNWKVHQRKLAIAELEAAQQSTEEVFTELAAALELAEGQP